MLHGAAAITCAQPMSASSLTTVFFATPVIRTVARIEQPSINTRGGRSAVLICAARPPRPPLSTLARLRPHAAPALTLFARNPLPSNFLNCCGGERGRDARTPMNTSDSACWRKWGAVELVPNPYNPCLSLTGRMWQRKNRLHPSETRPSRYLCGFRAHRYSIYAGSVHVAIGSLFSRRGDNGHALESATIRAACGERGAGKAGRASVLRAGAGPGDGVRAGWGQCIMKGRPALQG
jgi:hypothetical protein